MDIDYNMRLSFACALEAKELGDGPYGAIILNEQEEMIARAGNTTNSENSVTYHAEINVIQQAEYNRGKGNLKGCTIFCSAKPCPMCASAIIWSGIDTVIYAVSIDSIKRRNINHIDIGCRDILQKSDLLINVKGPHLEEEGMEVFRE